MGLKCSVLGHKYGDVSVERDREEQGSEVVITIREVETCQRCGTERVVSENKEVTAISTPDEPREDASASSADADVGSTETDTAGAPDETGGVPDEAAADDVDGGGEILDAEAGEPVDDELADPSVDAGVESSTAEPTETPDEDAVVIDEDAESAEGERRPGEWPEEPRESPPEPEWSPADPDEESSPATDTTGAVTVPEGRFRCPECGYTTAVEASSLREGDFCPDCRTGTLVHEPEDPTRNE